MNLFYKLIVLMCIVFVSQNKTPAQADSEDKLSAQISVHYRQTVDQPSAKEATHSETTDITFNAPLDCDVMTMRLKSMVKSGRRTANCDASTHCPILTGSNHVVRYNASGGIDEEKHANIAVVSKAETIKDERSGKLELSSTYTAKGSNDMDKVNLEIKPYVDLKLSTNSPLTPQYVIWLTGGIGFDFKSPQRKPVGDGSGQRYDYEKDALVPMQGPFNIQIPSGINEADHVPANGEVYEQLLITNSKEFETYLLNPKGNFTIKASGNRHSVSEGTQEVTGNVEVEILLSDWGVLNKLKPSK